MGFRESIEEYIYPDMQSGYQMIGRLNPVDLKELSADQLTAWLEAHGIAPYRAGQILRWVYLRQADSFDAMTDLNKALRQRLAGHFTIERLTSLAVETSKDGTRKFLFGLSDGLSVESVLIPERDHFTLCVSTQVGCAQGCRFCLTAAAGFRRNLTRGEIIAQVRDVQNGMTGPRPLSNIVFMGMGEPLANYDHLIGALGTITDGGAGLKFSTRRVTISTAGLVSRFDDVGRDTRANLAVSLNATDNATRDRLMPINRKFPIEQLLAACRRFPLPPGRRITIEYILLGGINDTEADAGRLAALLRGIRAKINLIPFNAHGACDFAPPEERTILRFQEILIHHNYTVMIRRSKGGDISAACGQLQANRR